MTVEEYGSPSRRRGKIWFSTDVLIVLSFSRSRVSRLCLNERTARLLTGLETSATGVAVVQCINSTGMTFHVVWCCMCVLADVVTLTLTLTLSPFVNRDLLAVSVLVLWSLWYDRIAPC